MNQNPSLTQSAADIKRRTGAVTAIVLVINGNFDNYFSNAYGLCGTGANADYNLPDILRNLATAIEINRENHNAAQDTNTPNTLPIQSSSAS